jgi:hypothetical protein
MKLQFTCVTDNQNKVLNCSTVLTHHFNSHDYYRVRQASFLTNIAFHIQKRKLACRTLYNYREGHKVNLIQLWVISNGYIRKQQESYTSDTCEKVKCTFSFGGMCYTLKQQLQL